MEENKRTYEVLGTVTIGTDEYRDLLTDKFEAEKRASEEHDRWYKVYCEKGEMEKKCKELKEELDKLKKFIQKKSVKFGEDDITVIMSMFGEE